MSDKHNIVAQFLIILTPYFAGRVLGKGSVSASEKISVCACRDQFPLASEQNIANPFFLIM